MGNTQAERVQQAQALYDAMTPDMRAQFMEMLRALVKAQESGRDAEARAAISATIEKYRGQGQHEHG